MIKYRSCASAVLAFSRASPLPLLASQLRTPVPFITPLSRNHQLPFHAVRPLMSAAPTPTPTPTPTSKPSQTLPNPDTPSKPFRLLYDSECPLCLKEVNFLRKRSERMNANILFVDITSDDYVPSENANLSYETAMKTIHGVTPDGTIVTGVPVFREVYERIGLGWVYAITQVPGVGWLADRVYDLWASKRMELTGRGSMAQALQRKKSCKTEQ